MALFRHTWLGFLARHRPFDASARLLSAIGGVAPRHTRARIHAAFARKEIDVPGLETRLQALKVMAEAYASTNVGLDFRDPREWENVGGGGRRRLDLLDPVGLEPVAQEAL